MPSLEDIKLRGRRVLAERASFDATITDDDHPEGVAIRVRWHNRIDRNGDLDGNYAEVIEGIDRLIFSDENVADTSALLVLDDKPPLVIERNAVVKIPALKGASFSLDTREPSDGPLETIWVVARLEG